MDMFGNGYVAENVTGYNFEFRGRILDKETKSGTDPSEADFASD
jgi:hypothetical protein